MSDRFIPDHNYESICCGVVSSDEIDEYKTGRCSKCKDNSGFVPVSRSHKRQPCDSNCTNCNSIRC